MHVKIQFCDIKNEYPEPAECKNKSLNKVKKNIEFWETDRIQATVQIIIRQWERSGKISETKLMLITLHHRFRSTSGIWDKKRTMSCLSTDRI